LLAHGILSTLETRGMPFKVVRATVDDVPDIVRVHDEAFAADVMMSQLFIKVNPTVRKASNIAFFTTKFTQALVMGFEVWKAVDVDTGYVER
jgi:branched-subunit amino acid transport protein AzlD